MELPFIVYSILKQCWSVGYVSLLTLSFILFVFDLYGSWLFSFICHSEHILSLLEKVGCFSECHKIWKRILRFSILFSWRKIFEFIILICHLCMLNYFFLYTSIYSLKIMLYNKWMKKSTLDSQRKWCWRFSVMSVRQWPGYIIVRLLSFIEI